MFFPHKESFPKGFMKLFPEEFIVEEIDKSGAVLTIDQVNVLSETSNIPGEGETIYATLVKCTLSTLEVVKDLSRQLNIPEKSIGYAGIKDKHAVTAQRVSMRGVDEKALRKVSSQFYFLKDVIRAKGVMNMADLSGNRFGIFIRTETGADLPQFNSKTERFYNYFYLQRFGSPRFVNFLWGLELLRGDYKTAVRRVMFEIMPRELPFISSLRREARAKQSWQEVRDIFDPVIPNMHCEAPMLERLTRDPQDFIGALNTIPDQVQLWLYGFGSLLFNEKIASFARKGIEPPKTLPFIFSFDKADVDTYREELSALGLYPLRFQNLKPLPFIRLAHRETNTMETASNIVARPTAQGVHVSFSLPKGAYATTFLSHHIDIVTDLLPKNMSSERVDTNALAESPERAKTIELFKKLPSRPIEPEA
jgi:TruD family tRNA pseudouridine synthase